MNEPPRYLSVNDAAALLGVSAKTIDRGLKNPIRPLPHYRIGRRIIIDREELDRWVRSQRARPVPVSVSSHPDVRDLLERLQGA
jgi:excisionase family DNA binding protein